MRFFQSFSPLLLVVASISFAFLPQLDITTSQFFYNKEHGFFLGHIGIVEFFFHLVPVLVWTILIVITVITILITIHKSPFYGIGYREIIYLLLSFAIGPGLIVNTLLKEHWGRARPSQIIEFGGIHHFSPAFFISDQCAHNCSFVSGHAAVGFYFISFALLLKKWRKTGIAAAILFGCMIGLVRIAQGGHFISDVVISGVITGLTAYVLYQIIIVRHRNLEKEECQKPSAH